MSYGRNFEIRRDAQGGARQSRFCTNVNSAVIPIGAPIIVDTTVGENGLGLKIVKLAPEGTARGSGATKGTAIYEYGPDAFVGDDPNMVSYADKGIIPAGAAVQLIAGDPSFKVCFRNTVARLFLGIRSYPGRVMVDGLGATPTVIVGQYLTPGVGNDTAGWWKPTATEADAWFEVTKVDSTRGEVEARQLF